MEADYDTDQLIENDVPSAFANKEIQLYYQLQFNIEEEIVGLEILSRWNHPKLGFISPAIFIRKMEKKGLCDIVNNYTIDNTFNQIKKISFKKQFKISFNLATTVHEKLFDSIIRINERINSHVFSDLINIDIELTENIINNLTKNSSQKLNSYISDNNISLSIDDFGTDNSSFKRFITIDFKYIKIDKSITDLLESNNTKAINVIHSIVGMAKTLKCIPVLEGVETKKQLQLIQSMGDILIQGFYYHKPEPLSNLKNIIK